MAQVECQLADIHNADYHELGAAVDMIKDLAETANAIKSVGEVYFLE